MKRMRIGSERSFPWRRLLAIAIAGGTVAACGVSTPQWPSLPALSVPSQVLVRTGGHIVSVPIEDYVLASALAEVTPLNESPATVERIYEVQAVLARTYAASHVARHRAEGFDLCDATHCQLYDPARIRTSRFASAAREAVQRTAGVVLAYSQRPAEALFHADCGGYTAAADAVWGGAPVPYLLPAPDKVPSAAHRTWKLSIAADVLRAALNADSRSRVGGKLTSIEVRERDVSGRASQVALNGEVSHVVRGEDLRTVLNQKLGDRAVQSTKFTIARAGQFYTFQGAGFGHGVGLCQLGAEARARRGESLETILTAYFPGVKIARVR